MKTISIASFQSKINNQKASIADIFNGLKTIPGYIQTLKHSANIKKEFKEVYKRCVDASEGKLNDVSTLNLNHGNTQITNTIVHTQDGPMVKNVADGNIDERYGSPISGHAESFNGVATFVDEKGTPMLGIFDVDMIAVPNIQTSPTTTATQHSVKGSIITETGIEINLNEIYYGQTPEGPQFDLVNDIKMGVEEVITKAEAIKNASAPTEGDGTLPKVTEACSPALDSAQQ